MEKGWCDVRVQICQWMSCNVLLIPSLLGLFTDCKYFQTFPCFWIDQGYVFFFPYAMLDKICVFRKKVVPDRTAWGRTAIQNRLNFLKYFLLLVCCAALHLLTCASLRYSAVFICLLWQLESRRAASKYRWGKCAFSAFHRGRNMPWLVHHQYGAQGLGHGWVRLVVTLFWRTSLPLGAEGSLPPFWRMHTGIFTKYRDSWF